MFGVCVAVLCVVCGVLIVVCGVLLVARCLLFGVRLQSVVCC